MEDCSECPHEAGLSNAKPFPELVLLGPGEDVYYILAGLWLLVVSPGEPSASSGSSRPSSRSFGLANPSRRNVTLLIELAVGLFRTENAVFYTPDIRAAGSLLTSRA